MASELFADGHHCFSLDGIVAPRKISLAATAAKVGVKNPAVIVIGDVVAVPNLLAAESAFAQSVR
jgi:predicted tellurium resistance membrane protein TerC